MEREPTNKEDNKTVIWIAVGIGIIVIVFYLFKGGGSSAALLSTPNPSVQQAAIQGQVAEQSAAYGAQSQAEQDILQYEQSLQSLHLGLAQINAQTKQTQIQANSQEEIAQAQDQAQEALANIEGQWNFKTTGVTTTGQETIAQYEQQAAQEIAQAQASAQETVAQDQANIQTTQSNNSFWGSILGGALGIFGL